MNSNNRRMKTIIPALFFLCVFIDPIFSQDNFKVIKVNGTILLKTNGVSLETGTVFSEKEDLLFRSEDATAAVINSQRGRLILTSKNHDLSKASSNYLPSMYNISTRGIPTGTLVDLKNQFSDRYVVLEKQYLPINSSNFPMDNNHFFFLRYIYKGEEINKKLSFRGDTLILDKENLYTVDGNQIPNPDNTAITLFYMKGSEYVLINNFNLIFPDLKQLTKEVQIILDEIKEKPVREKMGEVDSFIKEFYGNVHRDNLISWLKSSFGIKAD